MSSSVAVYSDKTHDSSDKDHLAIGRIHSSEGQRNWQEANPKELDRLLNERFSQANDRHQYRRIIRYLKRWKDCHFDSAGFQAPRGIALTVSAYNWFQPQYSDFVSQKACDLDALIELVSAMLNNFVYDSYQLCQRLKVELPVIPRNDLFEKMSCKQMATFQQNMRDLLSELKAAKTDPDPVTACQRLRDKVFGSDFPVPERVETARKTSQVGIIGTHESA